MLDFASRLWITQAEGSYDAEELGGAGGLALLKVLIKPGRSNTFAAAAWLCL